MQNDTLSKTDGYKQKQAAVSAVLIIVILVLVSIYFTCTYNTENEELYLGTLACPIVTILLLGYILTYRGKEHLTSRVLFFIFLMLTMLSIIALVYVVGLAKSFAH